MRRKAKRGCLFPVATRCGLWALSISICFGCEDDRSKLKEDWEHPSPVIRSSAVRDLARIGDEEAFRLVSRSLRDSSVVVRIAAVESLGDFKERDTTATVIQATRDKDPEVREAAVKILTRGKSDMARRALVRMLLFGEPSMRVRRLVYESLGEMGLSGERLAGEVAQSQIDWLREQMAEATGVERGRLIRLAGWTVHPGGLDIVLGGLQEAELDAVLAALAVLDGRGGAKALQRVQLLQSDRALDIRLASVRALPAFGPEGLDKLPASLRDEDHKVRLEAIEQMQAHGYKPAPEAICPVIADEVRSVSLAAAQLVSAKGIHCDLAFLAARLEVEDAAARWHAARVLSTVGGTTAVEILSTRLKAAKGQERYRILAALGRSGDRRASMRQEVRQSLVDLLQRWTELADDWVKDKIPPLVRETDRPVAEKKLTDAELAKLYSAHGLPPAGEESPRGVQDILASYPSKLRPESAAEIVDYLLPGEAQQLGILLEALLYYDKEEATKLAPRVLAMKRASIVSHACRVLSMHECKLELDEQTLDAITKSLDSANADQVLVMADWLARQGDARIIDKVLELMDKVEWESRKALIQVLGEIGGEKAVQALMGMLSGYAAIPAAKALAKIGDPRAIEAIHKATEQAGPGEEIILLMALARLGDRKVLPEVQKRLHASDPEIRKTAVRVLSMIGGQEAAEALRNARYDLDRRVRLEVERALEQMGDARNGSRDTQGQGRGGQPAQER